MSRNPITTVAFPNAGIGWRLATAGLLIVLGVGSAIPPAGAEVPTGATADAEVAPADRDRALLAALGLDLATIEQTDDAALLWRAVRELVLPGRVSETTQERILRRVWLADPQIHNGSRLDSPAN
jgi:hypothetical protein